MSHFNFESAISDATKLDGPMQRGPPMRWQRKALEAGVQSLSLDAANNIAMGPHSARTPALLKSPLTARQTPASGGVSNKTLLSPYKTPNKKTPTSKSAPPSPRRGAADRFIPNRASMDMEASHHMLTRTENVNPVDPTQSPASSEYQRKMSSALNKGAGINTKILTFGQKAPEAREGYMNNLKAIYTAGQTTKTGPTSRHIPREPEQVLDAPELLDDYYLNLISWSSQNHLAAGLGSVVYLWNADTGNIVILCELSDPEDYITSVAWIAEGNILAVGNSLGCVELWDVSQQKSLRTMGGHAGRVASLAWNSYILSSGARTGKIFHSDVRIAQHHVGTLSTHTGEVCGLTWSPNGRQLASGGNDNLLCLWDARLDHTVDEPVYSFTHHQAAVKALAWCPWQHNMLASGGGTADRHIRIWNTSNGTCVNSVDTESQVCALLWSKEYKEIISGHGYSQNQLTIWKYPSMVRVLDLKGHTARVLSMAMSPDGSTVISAGGDESLFVWKCFQMDKTKKVVPQKPKEKKSSLLMRGIR